MKYAALFYRNCLCILASLFLANCSDKIKVGDTNPADIENAEGKLFIIGGGEKTPGLMQSMIEAAGIDSTNYIAVLPMSSEEPDSAYLFFSEAIGEVSNIKCVNLNFTEHDLINEQKLDSLKNSKLIFITGGDQNKFMSLVRNTPIHDAIKEAYQTGSMVGGTSAGAAMMSKVMLTGDENFSPEYASTYDKIWLGNGIYAEGLGLLNNVIVDQHFVVRSRYNRLISALCDYPGMMAIGVDEETAIIVHKSKASVVGDSQVIVFYPTEANNIYFHHAGIRSVRLDVLLPGDEFDLIKETEK